ncbi:MAG: glucosylceramidase [Armatimonadota bacterium]|nr:MAG: glucosylceramidase [Armatimonadota bacterium]
MPHSFCFLGLVCLVLPVLLATSRAAGDEVRFDFETGDLQGWAVVAGKFDRLICDREMCRNTPEVKLNHQGRYFLSTVELADGGFNDTMIGVIESPVFVLTEPTISFLVGGGAHPDTYVALCTEDGTEVLKASGRSAELMRRVVWDAHEFVGVKMFVSIVDRRTGGWGHVTFDDFTATGRIDLEATAMLRRTFAQRERARIERERALAARRKAEAAKHRRQLSSDDYLFSRGRQRVYRGEQLTGISLPVGGIGSGCIQMDGRGVRTVWQIFNNHEQASVPHSFFAVRAKSPGAPAMVRALQTAPVGPFAAMKSLSFRGEYPFGWYDFKDPQLPVSVSLETFNPLIPLNARDSAIPCAIYNLSAENRGDETAEVSFLATQQNAVGFTGKGAIDGRSHGDYGGNMNRIARVKGATVLHMSADMKDDAPGSGDMALAAIGEAATATAAWRELDALAAAFANDGELHGPKKAGPSPPGATTDAALAVPFKLKPGEKRTVTFVLAWHFPNAAHGNRKWGGRGNMYANWWGGALDVAREVASRLPELTQLTRLYHDTLYSSNLPRWLLDRIGSQVAILRSQTCFWTKDGYFGGWEGCVPSGGCCLGNCSHVWHYAQAHARLFPEIGRIMREQELRFQTPDGGIPHRQAPNFGPAFDGQCGIILGAYREHLVGPDRRWLGRHWPKVKLAMDYTIATWDADEDGVLAGAQWNTLDEALGGSSSWLGTLYLAALAAAEKMAALQEEPDTAARYRRIRESGSARQDETLFNGDYYIQIPDAEPRKDYMTGCHIDQVLGQWWAHQLDLGWLYPPARVRTALRSLVKHNFRPHFVGIAQAPRKFVDDSDAGLQMITWPAGGRPDPQQTMFYADEVMTGFEYSAAAAMMQSDLLNQGFMIVRAVADRYDGRLRTGLTGPDSAAWGYSGNPFGDDECGKFYARAMSVWSMLLACQGFIYDGPAGVIGFEPKWRPEDHVSFFTAAEGWGLFAQKRTRRQQTERIEMRRGQLRVRTMIFAAPRNRRPVRVTVTAAGAAVPASLSVEDSRITVSLASGITVREGEIIEVTLR